MGLERPLADPGRGERPRSFNGVDGGRTAGLEGFREDDGDGGRGDVARSGGVDGGRGCCMLSPCVRLGVKTASFEGASVGVTYSFLMCCSSSVDVRVRSASIKIAR